MEIGTLVIVVLKARNLPDKHSLYKQDVYAQAIIHGKTKNTSVDVKGGQHPVWDEELRFPIYKSTSPDDRKLEVSCWRKEPRDVELIGTGEVDVTETLRTGEFDDWVKLESNGQYRGELYLEMTYFAAGPAPLQRRATKMPTSERLTRLTQPYRYDDMQKPPPTPPKNPSPPRTPRYDQTRPSATAGAYLTPHSSAHTSPRSSPHTHHDTLPPVPQEHVKNNEIPDILRPGNPKGDIHYSEKPHPPGAPHLTVSPPHSPHAVPATLVAGHESAHPHTPPPGAPHLTISPPRSPLTLPATLVTGSEPVHPRTTLPYPQSTSPHHRSTSPHSHSTSPHRSTSPHSHSHSPMPHAYSSSPPPMAGAAYAASSQPHAPMLLPHAHSTSSYAPSTSPNGPPHATHTRPHSLSASGYAPPAGFVPPAGFAPPAGYAPSASPHHAGVPAYTSSTPTHHHSYSASGRTNSTHGNLLSPDNSVHAWYPASPTQSMHTQATIAIPVPSIPSYSPPSPTASTHAHTHSHPHSQGSVPPLHVHHHYSTGATDAAPHCAPDESQYAVHPYTYTPPPAAVLPPRSPLNSVHNSIPPPLYGGHDPAHSHSHSPAPTATPPHAHPQPHSSPHPQISPHPQPQPPAQAHPHPRLVLASELHKHEKSPNEELAKRDEELARRLEMEEERRRKDEEQREREDAELALRLDMELNLHPEGEIQTKPVNGSPLGHASGGNSAQTKAQAAPSAPMPGGW